MSLTKVVMRFRKNGKLSPRFIGPFKILSRVRKVSYKLALTPRFPPMHHVFHVFMLWKYVSIDSYVLSFDSVVLGPNFFFEKDPIAILGI